MLPNPPSGAAASRIDRRDDIIEFDPKQMPWWWLSMALAWIAWPNTQQIQEHCAEYWKNWLHWFPGSWNVEDRTNSRHPHSIRRVETQSIRDVATGSIARLSHQATSSPELWLSR
jgi:hypothetical protein